MAGRVLAFADEEVIRTAREDFVAVACDDWYQRRRRDAEGDFFRGVADQGPRAESSTKQGIYVLTADGRLLGYKNAGHHVEVTLELLREGKAKFDALPESARSPGAVQVPDLGEVDSRFARTPPAGGLVVNVFSRALDRTADGGWADASCEVGSGDEAGLDHLWLTEAEWRSLLPAPGAKAGNRFPVPAGIARRIARFHLVDNTRGEPPFWEPGEVRTLELTATVEASTADTLRMRIEGPVLLSTDDESRGFDAAVLGHVELDRAAGRVTRFDLVAVGEHWGEGTYTGGARPGRTPFGVALELSPGGSPADSVAPQAARNLDEYFATGR